MRSLLAVLAGVCLSAQALALYNVGDSPRNYCWKDVNDKTRCLEDKDIKNTVRVLLYNTGWCGPCNQEFSQLARATAEFAGQEVTFISLSAAGWSGGSFPDRQFLTQWQTRHQLDRAKASFIVAASPRNAGADFFPRPSIPNVAIIDLNGKVAYKEIAPGVPAIVRQVRRLLPRPVPYRP